MLCELMPLVAEITALKIQKADANGKRARRQKGNMEKLKSIGRFVAFLNLLLEVFKKADVGEEVFEWAVGDGKEATVTKFTLLAEEFKARRRWYVVNENTIMVNLDPTLAPLRLPLNGAVSLNTPTATGWAKVERINDKLFANGREMIPWLAKGQKDGKVIGGHALRKEVETKDNVHPNIWDALIEHDASFTPERYKKDTDGNVLYNFCWAVVFEDIRDSHRGLYVRFFFWFAGGPSRDYGCLDCVWGAAGPASLLASSPQN